MDRLLDLNNYSNETISYEDGRDANVIFNLITPIDQSLSINENRTHVIPRGIEIVEIIDYVISNVSIDIDFTNYPSAVNLIYSSLPTGVSVVETSSNVYRISQVQSADKYKEIIESIRVQVPFNLSGYFPYTVTINYTVDGTTLTKSWDVLLTIVAIDYMSNPTDYTYTPNRTATLPNPSNIIVVVDEFNPTWTINLTPSVVGMTDNISSAGTGGVTGYNSSTGVFTITGNKEQVNSHLNSITIDYSFRSDDFYWSYILSNSITADIDITIQNATNTELSANFNNAMSFVIEGFDVKFGVANLQSASSFETDVFKIRDFSVDIDQFAILSVIANPNTKQGQANISSNFNLSCNAFGGNLLSYTTTASNTESVTVLRNTNVNLTIDWGDGTSQTITENDISSPSLTVTKNYGVFQAHTIKISGNANFIIVNDAHTIHTWGSDVFPSLPRFIGISAVPDHYPSNWTDMDQLFDGSPNFNDNNVTSWDVSHVTSMKNTFYEATSFNQDISSWNVGNVTNMEYCFFGATSFNQDISSWNISNVTTLRQTFRNATAFNANIGSWNTSSVTNMDSTFRSATNFNQNIGNWNTANVTNMTSMFASATSFNQDLTGWCVTNIPTEPNTFAFNSGLSTANYPVWGTCP